MAHEVAGTHRYGNGGARIVGADLVTLAGEAVRAWVPRLSVVLRISFRVHAALPVPIAGFLVRNAKGETIFGSNTMRENYPMPEMDAGDTETVEFHLAMPELAAGRYFVSIAVSEGTLDEFGVCDYVENAIAIDAGGNATGYVRLRCASITVSRT